MGVNSFWRFGANAGVGVDAARRVEIIDAAQQLRLTQSNGNGYAEFFVRNNSRLLIMPNGANTGFTTAGNTGYNPTERIDVDGTARLRNVVTGTADALIIGTRNDGAANDLTLRRLNFTGNSNQVLLGNGTWGTLPPVTPVITANNGILNNGGVLQLGAPCNNGAALFASAITQDRSVFMTNGNSFWFSTLATSTGGIGLGAQPASTPFCGVGNTVEISANNASAYGTTNSSGLRFTQLNSGSTTIPNGTNGVNSTKVLTVDGNGDVVLTNSNSSFGVNCSDNINGILDQDKKVNLNNNRFYVEDPAGVQTFGENRFGIGYTCGNQLPGKFSSFQLHSSNVSEPTFAGHFVNKDIHTVAPQPGSIIVGVYGEATGLQLPNNIINNLGGQFLASNARFNTGVRTTASSPIGQFTRNIGISSFSINGQSSSGVVTNASGGIITNTGVLAQAFGSSTQSNTGGSFFAASSTLNNFGMGASATGGQNAYGVYCSASGASGVNRAGYFIGIVEGTSGGIFTSDSIFKDSVSKLPAALNIIEMLSPKQYVMDAANYPRFNFDNKTQFGFIAQEVEQVLPNLVYQSHMPAEYDSLGNEIAPAMDYKSLNYNGFIALNTAGIIALNGKILDPTRSDSTVKTNVQDLTGSLDKVLEMRGVSYDWNHSARPDLNLDSTNHIGFIAQEIQTIDPRLTFMNDDNLMHVQYDKVVPILAEAIQELNDVVEEKDSIINNLNDRLSALENCLAGVLPFLCQMNQQAIQANTPQAQEQLRKDIAVTLTNRSTIILDQNVPNPFAEQTVINFSIPETVKKAQIHFYNQEGRIIQTVDVLERGLGSVTVFGADLSSGVYTYTLVADGQIVATKKMMKM